jgi:poly(A) polymerase
MADLESLPGLENATIVPRDEHNISRKDISPNALKVLGRLNSADYYAFLVGGGVRDLLLGNQPKDFDIATDATPEEVRTLFRNSRIIGRRFKIVHIRFGREIIEVTTFRAHHEVENEIERGTPRKQIRDLDSAHSSEGMILRDNVYGDIDEDALRRDFTINALYYTTDGFRLLDFSTGVEDLRNRQLRMIGDPSTRYKEDPVRMLRALRFSAKLGFTLEKSTAEPIDKLAHLLASISPARLFDETLKLFTTGYAAETFRLLENSPLGDYVIGPTLDALETCDDPAANLIDLALENTDRRLEEGKSVTPYFLFAALLWPVLRVIEKQLMDRDEFDPGKAANQAIAEQLELIAIPKRITYASKEIWELQERLQRPTQRNVHGTFNNPKFRAAYDFLLLREDSGEDLGECAQWWTDFQDGDTKKQAEMREALQGSGRRKRRRRRGPSKKSS